MQVNSSRQVRNFFLQRGYRT